MSNTIKKVRISEGVFGTSVVFYWGGTEEMLLSKVGDLWEESGAEGLYWWQSIGGVMVRGIWVKEMDINSIAHELHHMVDHILETKAIHRGNNDETGAYLMGYYIEEILRKVGYGLKKLPKKRKKKVK